MTEIGASLYVNNNG